ncbi:hypothetical protein CYMTET_3189, partial [Cymbomonas tetramitiformis]
VHTEMHALMWARALAAQETPQSFEDFDLAKFLTFWDFERSLSATQRRALLNEMRSQVVEAFYHRGQSQSGPPKSPEDWEPFYSQVMMRQQDKITKVLKKFEELQTYINEGMMRSCQKTSELQASHVARFGEPESDGELIEQYRQILAQIIGQPFMRAYTPARLEEYSVK